MRGRRARPARDAGFRSSFVELLEDRALPSGLVPNALTHGATTAARSQDAARLGRSAVVSKSDHAAVSETENPDLIDASRLSVDPNQAVPASQVVGGIELESNTRRAVVPAGRGLAAVI